MRFPDGHFVRITHVEVNSLFPSGRCTPLYVIRETLAENRENNWKKFYQHQTSRNLFLQRNRQVEPIDLLPEIRRLTNVSSSIDKNAILPSLMNFKKLSTFLFQN